MKMLQNMDWYFLFLSFIAGNETREGSSCERDRSATDPGVEGEEVVNPYPLVIVPKYGSPTPLKNRGKKKTYLPKICHLMEITECNIY